MELKIIKYTHTQTHIMSSSINLTEKYEIVVTIEFNRIL